MILRKQLQKGRIDWERALPLAESAYKEPDYLATLREMTAAGEPSSLADALRMLRLIALLLCTEGSDTKTDPKEGQVRQ